MTKTFKLGIIFFVTVVVFIGLRIVAPFIPVADNWLSWGFGFVNQVFNLCVLPIVLYKLFVSKKNKDLARDFRLNPKVSLKVWGLTIAVALLMYFVTMGVAVVNNVVLQLSGYTFPNSVGAIYSSPWVLVMEIITGAMFPAFCEEFADRGLLLAVLDGERNENKKILLMAIMFGLLHQNIQQFGYAVFGGFVLAYLAIKTRSIFPGMLVHFFNNFMGILVDYSSQKGGVLGKLYGSFFNYVNKNLVVMLLIWAAAAVLLVFVLRLIGKAQRREEPVIEVTEIVGKQAEIRSLFGMAPEMTRLDCPAKSVRKWEYGFIYAVIAMTALTTLFTFIWGLLR